MTKYFQQLVFLLLTIQHASCFVAFHHIASRTSLNSDQNGAGGGLFESEGWEIIKKDLDRVPIFAVATKEGNPLAYKVEIKGKGKVDVQVHTCNLSKNYTYSVIKHLMFHVSTAMLMLL